MADPRALIGVFVLVATWAPSLLLLGAHPERVDPTRRFVALGGVVGVLSVIAVRLVGWEGLRAWAVL